MGTISKRKEHALYISKVQSALVEAHAAAEAAVADFMQSAQLNGEGLVIDGMGAAFVTAYRLKPRLRLALKSLREIERGDRGAWIVSNFSRHVPKAACQSITAHRNACSAAAKILSQNLEGDGEFFAHGYDT
jgi:hypothetical protein